MTKAALKQSVHVLAKDIGWDAAEIGRFLIGLGLVSIFLVLWRH